MNNEVTMETQHEILIAAARGYMLQAMALQKAGHKAGFLACLREEAKCFAMALELEDKINELNSYMMVA